MIHRDTLARAAGSTSVWLVAGAAAVALLQVAGALVIALLTGPWSGFLVWLVRVAVGMLAVAPFLPAYVVLAAVAREDGDPLAALRRLRGDVPAVLVATATEFGVALGGAVAGLGTVSAVHTAVRFAAYAGGRVTPPSPWPVLYYLLAGAVCGFWIGLVLTRHAPWLVAFEGRPARTAWLDSLDAVRRSPGTTLGYAALQSLTLGVALVAFLLVAAAKSLTTVALTTAIGVVVGTLGLALSAAIHAAYADVLTVPAPSGDRSRTARRVAMAGVVLLAAVGGAGVVRTADVEADGADPGPLTSDPDVAPDVALDATLHQSYRRTTTVSNESTANATTDLYAMTAVDYADRRVRMKRYGDGEYLGGFMGEGLLASHTTVPAGERVAADEWTHTTPVPGYGIVAPGLTVTTLDDADWRLANRSADRFVYRLDRPAAVEGIIPSDRLGTRGGLAEGSSATLVVDRERSVVDHVSYRLVSRKTGRAYTYHTRFSQVGTADVRRPASLGSRGPVEWLWDVLYY